MVTGVIGVAVGVVIVFGLRIMLAKRHDVHYHANFALYIDGVHDEFKNFTFYEETQACSVGSTSNDPKTRAHMHEPNNYVVHVHDSAVTWGDFFANLGYTLGDNLIKTDAGVFVDGAAGKKLSFILNGQPASLIADRVIGDKDALLISYGDEDAATLQKRYDAIPKDAEQFDTHTDPTSCSGSKPLTFSERLKQAFDFTK